MNDITQLLLAAGILINAIISALAFIRSGRNYKAIQSSAKAIDLLEKNTNSIKDALVKVTGESEHAKGMLAGAAQEKLEQRRT